MASVTIYMRMTPKYKFLVPFSFLTTNLHSWLPSQYMSWCSKISQSNVSQTKLLIFIILASMFPVSKWYHHQASCLSQKYGFYTQPLPPSLSPPTTLKVLSVFPSRISLISSFLFISTTTILARPTLSHASHLYNTLSAWCFVLLQLILHIAPNDLSKLKLCRSLDWSLQTFPQETYMIRFLLSGLPTMRCPPSKS